MTDQSVFQDTTQIKEGEVVPSTPPATSVPDSVFNDQLASIKNEHGGQKYDDVPKALEGLRNAQEFIPQLQSQITVKDTELAQLREAVAKHESVEDIVSRLKDSQASAETSAQGLGQDETVALVEQLLNSREKQSRSRVNMDSVQSNLVSKFGTPEAANAAVIEKAKELGTTAEELGKLSASNPKMVLAYFGNVQSSSTGAPDSSSINSDGLQSRQRIDEGLQRPEKSLLAGATSKEQTDFMKQIQTDVYKKFNVET